MKLALITDYLESVAPLNYQEDYDNAGLIVGQPQQEITGVLVALDCTELIVEEAIARQCNLIITHHPIVFKGLKRFNSKTYVERVVQKAIKNDIALYAIHTNLDHVANGVSGEICKRLGIMNGRVLAPKSGLLKKLVTFCPTASANAVKEALFSAGAGNIGNYSECSFSSEGIGTFNGNENTDPFVGVPGSRHHEKEQRIEVIFKVQDERKIVISLLEHHPYEDVAYDIYPLSNSLANVGAGMIGWLSQEMEGMDFLQHVKDKMHTKVIRHTAVLPKQIKKVAVCGGAGSFLLKDAIAAGADAFVTADFKYHEFFDAENKLIICDIGHYESEQFTSNLLRDSLFTKFPNLAIYLTGHNTNPVNYFS
ncbi:Nif3-like dinuclear metal center hexameric protein [Pedobacter insulae]|uniref:GTP cyclohydrolase 1 type 2 homolog n=1 Tax=Pedobacter insulae TaxID=414048 RepID=A0A1I2XA27_9SPHI|nr:Nif3-like dinuclear metal center hexameric protein [Pedobacter insulae]SFH10384.1 dinuclear metal center protein, YbgI/SA1388 family [Pedobacter insulae]